MRVLYAQSVPLRTARKPRRARRLQLAV